MNHTKGHNGPNWRAARCGAILGGGASRMAHSSGAGVASDLHGFARGLQRHGGDEPDENHGAEAQTGKTAGKPAAGGLKTAAAGSPPPSGFQPIANCRYWTIQKPVISDELRRRWKISPAGIEYPHDSLCKLGFETAKKLMSHLRTLGHCPRSLENGGMRFAEVELTAAGFRVTLVPTYAAAVQIDRTRKLLDASAALTHDQAREQLASQTAESLGNRPNLTPCPFCGQSDLLEIFNWSNERSDGTEYIGEAVRCNRCDCVVPLGAWNPLPGILPAEFLVFWETLQTIYLCTAPAYRTLIFLWKRGYHIPGYGESPKAAASGVPHGWSLSNLRRYRPDMTLRFAAGTEVTP